MAQIKQNVNYTICTLDGTDLYLTSTEDGSLVSLSALDTSSDVQQTWQLTTENELTSNGLYLNGSARGCTNIHDQPTTRNYYIIDGDDTNGYTMNWWSIDPEPNGQSLGYVVSNGSGVKIDSPKQKWKFTIKIKNTGDL